MIYQPDNQRYEGMTYARCGVSGLLLPRVSLGLWHNFGEETPGNSGRELVLHAFDKGITHFDLANNYGPPPGAAESCFGRILKQDLHAWRDELIISTKAGYTMWPGPYGDWGSRKYLMASLNQSLKRMGLDYVDIFYHHRPDTDTPLSETVGALADIVRQGKALYVGISNYPDELAARAVEMLEQQGIPCLIHQTKYSMFQRLPEQGLLRTLQHKGVGCIAYSPLAGGLLSDRYLQGIPADSRMAGNSPFLTRERLSDAKLAILHQLNALAVERGQSLAQMAQAWLLRDGLVTSVLIGASKTGQIDDAIAALNSPEFTVQQRKAIDEILARDSD